MGVKGPSDYRACSARSRRPTEAFHRRGNPQDVFENIRGKDVALRMAAIERLAKSPARGKSGRAILGLANAPEPDVRVLACGLIGNVKPTGSLKVLIEKIGDKDPNVRQAACMAIGKFHSSLAVKPLIEALNDMPWVACAAAFSLGEIGGKRAARQLLKIFHSGGSLKAAAACQALMIWNDDGVFADIVKRIRTWRGRKRRYFIRIILEHGGKEILDRLRHDLGSEVLAHLHHFVDTKEKAPLKLLALAATFRNPEVVVLILRELAKRDPCEEDFPDILKLLVDLHALWKDRPETYLCRLDEGFAIPIIKACVMTGTKIDSAALLETVLLSPLEVKREISGNLVSISQPSAPLVEALLSDPDDHVRGDAAEAARFFCMKEMAPCIEELARLGYPDTRQKSLRSLCVLDPTRAQVLAEQFVTNGSAEDQEVYLSAAELMDKEFNYRLIRRLLHSKESRVAAIAARIMGRLIEQDPRYMDMIGELLLRKRVLPEVLKIIKKNRLTTLQPKLLKLHDRLRHDPWLRYQTLLALAELEDQSLFDVFAAGLNDESNLTKIGCIKGIARLGQNRAAELISPFLSSADAGLRLAAKMAMDALTTPNDPSAFAGTN